MKPTHTPQIPPGESTPDGSERITPTDKSDAVDAEENLSDVKSRRTNTGYCDGAGDSDAGESDSDAPIKPATNEDKAPGDGRTGLTVTRQEPPTPTVTLDLDGRTVTDLWADLLDTNAGREALVDAVRTVADGRTVPELYDALDERDVPYWVHSWIRDVARGDKAAAFGLAGRIAPMLGAGRSTIEHLLATARLFDALDGAGTIAVRVGESFQDQRRDQREAVCSLLAALSRGFNVRVIGRGVTLAWLVQKHRADLPGVSEWCNTHRDRTPVAAAVDEALGTLDPDGRPAWILRALADEPGETTTYHALYAAATVGESAVRQSIGALVDLDLVDTFGPDSDKKVELLESGREYLGEITQQTTLSDGVSGTPQYHLQAVLPRTSTRGGEGEGRPYRTAYMSRPNHAAAAGCGGSGGVTLVEAAEEGADMACVRLVSYDEDREEAVVGVRATGAFHYMVSLATALASPRFLDRVLPPARVDALDDPPTILRDARCIGALSDEALEDAGALRDAFVEWGEEIADMTGEMQREEYEDRDRFRSEILRSAHGLAGSVVHLLDALGVDLVREIRVPGGLSFDHLEELARSVGISTAIQSQYGVFAAYRQLFEDREDKRRTALSPDVDAADPVGELIGSFVFRGPDVTRLRDALENHLSTPSDLVDDAPEFVVPVPIQEAGRPEYAATVARSLGLKRLRSTRTAVSVVQLFAGSPYAAADALHQLEPEILTRDVRADEVRYALGTLDADRLLSDLPPTVGKIVAALLRADERLTHTALADRADVSGESVRRHRDRIEALGIVDRDAAGRYRLTLSFPTREERRAAVTPENLDDRLTDILADVLETLLPPERYGDPSDPIGGALFWPPDPWGVADESARLTPWVEAAAALAGVDPPDRTGSVSIGPALEQTALESRGQTVASPGRSSGEKPNTTTVTSVDTDIRPETPGGTVR